MIKIVADVHEADSQIPELLRELGAQVEIKKLTVADYVVGESTAVERKSAQDFVNSVFSGRLFDQIDRLKKAYPRACLIVEGNPRDFLENERVVWGALFRITLDEGIGVVQTADRLESAQAIFSLAKREQENRKSKPVIRPKPRMLSLHEKQIYLVSGLPNIGAELAERLLNHFGSPREVFKATKKKLMEVPGIGEKKAREIVRVLDEKFRKLRQEEL